MKDENLDLVLLWLIEQGWSRLRDLATKTMAPAPVDGDKTWFERFEGHKPAVQASLRRLQKAGLVLFERTAEDREGSWRVLTHA